MGFTLLVFGGQVLADYLLGGKLFLQAGALVRSLVSRGEVWRLITPLFIHVHLLHVAVNMYSLYALGPAVERFFGSWRMLAFYLLSGVSGVAMSMAFSPRPSTGASGAIFGLLGALTAFLLTHRKLFGQVGMRQFGNLVFVAILNLGLGLAPGNQNIDNWAHFGGLLGGVALTLFLGPQLGIVRLMEDRAQLVDRQGWPQSRRRILIAAVVIVALALVSAFSPLGA
jgi:rhomboid protease GluP